MEKEKKEKERKNSTNISVTKKGDKDLAGFLVNHLLWLIDVNISD